MCFSPQIPTQSFENDYRSFGAIGIMPIVIDLFLFT
jgi:hypothetical protein